MANDHPNYSSPNSSAPAIKPPRPRSWRRIIARTLTTLVVLGIIFTLIGLIVAVGVYAYYSQSLPSTDELAGRREAQSTKIFDRNGEPLYEVFDPNSGRRTNVSIANIPPVMKQAIIATEDPSFYTNIGVDPRGIARAVYYIVTTGRPSGGGGSTITQQLV